MNLNRDYLVTVDVKQAVVNTPSTMQFYITDMGTSNIFAQLVINESNSELVKRYAPVENAEDFTITLRTIKPNGEPKSIEFTLLNKMEAFYIVDLADDFKDYIGEYQCELFVDRLINEKTERITTASFTYEILPSIYNDLDGVIEKDPDYPLVDRILSDLEAVDLSNYATKEYVDNKVASGGGDIGNISQITMEIVDGELIVNYPDDNTNVSFELNENGELEVIINE